MIGVLSIWKERLNFALSTISIIIWTDCTFTCATKVTVESTLDRSFVQRFIQFSLKYKNQRTTQTNDKCIRYCVYIDDYSIVGVLPFSNSGHSWLNLASVQPRGSLGGSGQFASILATRKYVVQHLFSSVSVIPLVVNDAYHAFYIGLGQGLRS